MASSRRTRSGHAQPLVQGPRHLASWARPAGSAAVHAPATPAPLTAQALSSYPGLSSLQSLPWRSRPFLPLKPSPSQTRLTPGPAFCLLRKHRHACPSASVTTKPRQSCVSWTHYLQVNFYLKLATSSTCSPNCVRSA